MINIQNYVDELLNRELKVGDLVFVRPYKEIRKTNMDSFVVNMKIFCGSKHRN